MTQTHAKAQARYSARANATRQARMLGWSETDIVAVFTTKQGTTVAIDSTGSRVPLVLDPTFDTVGAPASSVGSLSSAPVVAKKVWAPKNWPKPMWESMVDNTIKGQWTKEEVLKGLLDHVARGTLTEERRKTAAKIIQTVPDVPDWYTYLPRTEKED